MLSAGFIYNLSFVASFLASFADKDRDKERRIHSSRHTLLSLPAQDVGRITLGRPHGRYPAGQGTKDEGDQQGYKQ